MQATLQIEDLTIPIQFQREQRKTLSIKITREGSLLMKAPLTMREHEIERFIRQKRYWIYKQTKRVIEENQNRVYRSKEEVTALKRQAREVLTKKSDDYKEILHVNYTRIRIGDQKTRWGSCSSKGTISYNWRLILMPERIQNYVVVHELCHLLEMNHSPAFWKKVSEVLPDYQSSRKWLKEHGSQYL